MKARGMGIIGYIFALERDPITERISGVTKIVAESQFLTDSLMIFWGGCRDMAASEVWTPLAREKLGRRECAM